MISLTIELILQMHSEVCSFCVQLTPQLVLKPPQYAMPSLGGGVSL